MGAYYFHQTGKGQWPNGISRCVWFDSDVFPRDLKVKRQADVLRGYEWKGLQKDFALPLGFDRES